MDHYDVILGALPIAAGGITIDFLSPIAATASLALMAYVLFVNPPTDLSALHPKE